jgi:GH15 family glucan-1,4-alpha-glucosidase
MCLGHEIHITRYVIFDMLLQNRISLDDIIVTLKDRIFLYKKIFKNCISSEEFIEMNLNEKNYNIINLHLLTGNDIPVSYSSILENFQHQTLKNFCTPEFKYLLNNIDYCNTGYPEDKDYIIIHHRYNCSIDILSKIINKVNNTMNVNIIIFNNNISYLKQNINNVNNIIFIDNLQIYASYLNSNKCKLFISEWSGGGQLSHYCYDGKIMYYFNVYNDLHYVGNEKVFAEKSMETDMFQHWDFKHSRIIDINMFCKVDDVLNNI